MLISSQCHSHVFRKAIISILPPERKGSETKENPMKKR